MRKHAVCPSVETQAALDVRLKDKEKAKHLKAEHGQVKRHHWVGAKGVGEIGLVPTASAVANAFFQFNGERQYELPLKQVK